MEKKQLNFSAPLMSARRYSSPLRPSGEDSRRVFPSEDPIMKKSQQSDLNLGEVVKPGSVPFMWEQTPGRAKEGHESQVVSPEEFPSTPKLPPGRTSDFMPFPPGKKSGELNGFRTPNKLSGELVVLRQRSKLSGELNRAQSKFSGELNTLKPQKFSGELYTHRPHMYSGELNTHKPHKFSGEVNGYQSYNRFSGELHNLNKFSSLNDVMARWDKEVMNASSEDSENDDDATFSDAHDSFSQRDSFSANCSVGGMSGSERPDTKTSGTISTDPKAREFMMDRFLPAAKAMTLDPSQYASRKQLVVSEQSKEVKALVARANTPPPGRPVCNIVPYTGQDIGSVESEDEESSFDDRSAISVKIKACGFLPWFCSKNSLRLVNPLPSMKNRSKNYASKASQLVKTGLLKSPSTQKLAKHVPCSTHKNKVNPGFKSCELQKPKHVSRPMFYSGELQTRTGSPYRSSRRSSPSPYRNESPSLYQKGVGFLATPKRVDPYDDYQLKNSQKHSKRFEEQQRNMRTSSGTRTPVAEKTLYIDSVNITKVSHSILNLPKTKRLADRSGSVQEATKSESSFQEGVRSEILKARGMSGPLVRGAVVDVPPSETYVSGSVAKGVGRKFKSSELPKMSANGNPNTCRELVPVANETDSMQSPLNPPLPKSPSESWLSRKLPSISPRNSVSYSSLNSKLQSRKQNANAPASGAKWETIVKSSHLRHDYGRYSEELVTHIPQQPRPWK